MTSLNPLILIEKLLFFTYNLSTSILLPTKVLFTKSSDFCDMEKFLLLFLMLGLVIYVGGQGISGWLNTLPEENRIEFDKIINDTLLSKDQLGKKMDALAAEQPEPYKVEMVRKGSHNFCFSLSILRRRNNTQQKNLNLINSMLTSSKRRLLKPNWPMLKLFRFEMI